MICHVTHPISRENQKYMPKKPAYEAKKVIFILLLLFNVLKINLPVVCGFFLSAAKFAYKQFERVSHDLH
jgi:hypothetical protein